MSDASLAGGTLALLTLRQAAGRTGMSATTLRRYIKAGRIRARLVPGRYGPEYAVEVEELRASGLWDGRHDSTERPPPDPSLPAPRAAAPLPACSPLAATLPVSPPAAEGVPLSLFRELLMKHEQLLVQYGMIRVSGMQVHEVRQAAERRAGDAQRAADELVRARDRHAREIGLLKARLRQAELLLAERDEQIARLRQEMRRQEVIARNASRASAFEAEFQHAFVPTADH